jgi:inosose dehydratase
MEVRDHLESIFEDLARAGYDGVELFASTLDTPETVERVRSLSESHGLPVIAAYYSAPFADPGEAGRIAAEVERTSIHLASLNGKYLLFGNHRVETGSTVQEEARAAILSACGGIVQSHGLQSLYHTYSPDVAQNERRLQAIFSQVTDDLRLAVDHDWISRAGVDPLDFLRRWKDQVGYVHLRDSRAGKWVEAFGEGEVDFGAIRDVLDEIEFEGWVIVEQALERDFEPTRPISESLRLCREQVWEKMGL